MVIKGVVIKHIIGRRVAMPVMWLGRDFVYVLFLKCNGKLGRPVIS